MVLDSTTDEMLLLQLMLVQQDHSRVRYSLTITPHVSTIRHKPMHNTISSDTISAIQYLNMQNRCDENWTHKIAAQSPLRYSGNVRFEFLESVETGLI